MSTTTMTSTTSAHERVSLKPAYLEGAPAILSPPSTLAIASATPQTLRSLYQRAARAFLQKDIQLTYSMMESAFAILHPPSSLGEDSLDSQRRKWDILRITLESTVYCSSSASSTDLKALPHLLRGKVLHAKPLIVSEMHTRSMQLFTPTGMRHRASFLPAQIVTTLALASLKLECADSSRNIIEDWLAQRGHVDHVREDTAGYEKVLDLYCLHVLPSLRAWDYAHDFLEYELELPAKSRDRLRMSLVERQNTYLAELQNRTPSNRPSTPSVPSSSSQSSINRTPSPSPSTTSCSSMDTTSTRTVVPRTSRAKNASRVSALSPSSTSTPPVSEPNGTLHHGNGSAVHGLSSESSKGKQKAVLGQSSRHHATPSIPQIRTREQSRDSALRDRPSVTTVTYTDVFSLLKTYLRPHLTTNKLVFVALLIVFPLLSFILRIRRRRLLGLAGTSGAGAGILIRPSGSGTASSPPSAASEVRRRLRAQESGSNALSLALREIYRSVSDAVRMAGGGLV